MDRLNVFLNALGSRIQVGQLVLDGREILFKYSGEFLDRGFNISPLKLSFDDSIQPGPVGPFGGLHGVFADCLPDAWGMVVLKNILAREGLAIESLNSLEHLARVGPDSLGALSYEPAITRNTKEPFNIDLDSVEAGATAILEGESSEVIEELFRLGGSPGGARPKIYVGYNPQSDHLRASQKDMPEGFESWIIKFAAKVDPDDIAQAEMAYYNMASQAGVTMSESRLFQGKSGKLYFGTKRFDRTPQGRLHMISAAALFHDDYEQSQLDYGTLIQEGTELVGSSLAAEQLLRRAAFNVFAHNRDDHSKNFAFLVDQQLQWQLAPAYDLTFSSSSQGQHSTMCAGNAINPGTKELYELAEHFSLRRGKFIVDEVKEIVRSWPAFATETGVSSSEISRVGGRLLQIV